MPTKSNPPREFEPIPAGKYLAMITESEMKPTKSGSGSYLQLTFQILEGEYKGRFLWARLNLNNPNAHGRADRRRRAVGHLPRGRRDDAPRFRRTAQPAAVITVKCKKRDGHGRRLERDQRATPNGKRPTGQPQQAATNTPPWRRPA